VRTPSIARVDADADAFARERAQSNEL